MFFHMDDSPKSTDPADYPRSVKIDDTDALLMLLGFEEKTKEVQRLFEELNDLRERILLAQSEQQITQVRLFRALRALHPEIAQGMPIGWRKHDETYWYVGWDHQHQM